MAKFYLAYEQGVNDMATNHGITAYQRMAVDIFFPDGHVCCDLCPLLETYARRQCRRTGEYILDSRATGLWCPLQTIERSEDLSASLF